METTVKLETPSIPLSALLKLAGLAETGGRAKHLVQDGLVRLNGETERRRGAQVRPGDVVELESDPPVRVRVT